MGIPSARGLPLNEAVRSAGEAYQSGVPSVLLFGTASHRDPRGSEAYRRDALIPRAVRELKRLWPRLVVITDVCLCGYTSHGHCGVLDDGVVDHERTLALMGQMATLHAQAGADLVFPSASLDHQTGRIRRLLDEAECSTTGILSGTIRLASMFGGPEPDGFRVSAQVLETGNYQQDIRNAREADRVIDIAVSEGADLVSITPALPALDLIHRARQRWPVPVVAVQSAAEVGMLRVVAGRGWAELRSAIQESVHAIRRAGADFVVAHDAAQLARWDLQSEE